MNESLKIVCGQCNSVNRVPSDRIDDAPSCGNCHRPLFDGHPLALTGTSFPIHIARSDIPIVVDFWAPWCGPCKMMAPAFEQAAREIEPRFRLVKVDTEQEPELAAKFAIRSIPTLAIFRDGREVARQAGAMSAADITRWVKSQT